MVYIFALIAIIIAWIVINVIKGYRENDEQPSKKASNYASEIKRLSEDPNWKKAVENANEPKEKRVNKSSSLIRKIELKGVWFDEERKFAFKEVKEGDQVLVRFDYNNTFDSNALGVYIPSGKLLGYLPRDNKRIIGLFRKIQERDAKVINKNDGPSQWNKIIIIELSIV